MPQSKRSVAEAIARSLYAAAKGATADVLVQSSGTDQIEEKSEERAKAAKALEDEIINRIADEIRLDWTPKKWPPSDGAFSASRKQREMGASSVKPVEGKLRLYPWLSHIAAVAKRLSPNHPALRIINYQLLREAYDLDLYRPFAPDHRLFHLFDAFYFPNAEELPFTEHARFARILAFNGDYQLYQHLFVVHDRTLSNPAHNEKTLWFLPRLALITTLFGDYPQTMYLAQQAITRIKVIEFQMLSQGLKDADLAHLRHLEQELEGVSADAESQISSLENLNAAMKPLTHRLEQAKRFTAQNKDKVANDHLLRLHYCAYFRNMVRCVLNLREKRKPYDLPDDLQENLTAYTDLVTEYRRAISTPPLGGSRYLNVGSHYLGLDLDTLSRSYGVLATEVAVRSTRGRGIREPQETSRKQVKDFIELARKLHTESKTWFDNGDEDDEKFIAANIGTLAPSMTYREIKCGLLSAYRKLSGECILEYCEAVFAPTQARFETHRGRARTALNNMANELTPERMKHSKALYERLSRLIDEKEFRFNNRSRFL